MKVLLVDDSRLARLELRNQLQHCPQIEIVGEAENVAQALQQVIAGIDAERKCRCNFERGTRRQAATDWHSGSHRAREAARCHVAFAHGCRHASDVATPCGLHCCRVANG